MTGTTVLHVFSARHDKLKAWRKLIAFVPRLSDFYGHAFEIPAEDVRTLPNTDLIQVTFRMPMALQLVTAKSH